MTQPAFRDPSQFCVAQVANLGDGRGPQFDGIYVPSNTNLAVRLGVTDQFLRDADVYHRSNFEPARYEAELREFLTSSGASFDAPLTILDVGSGSGNSVIPLLSLFPAATVVATDISEDMLAILRREVLSAGHDPQRLAILCLDLHDSTFKPEIFDLVVGGSILHHLADPSHVLAHLADSLRVGGEAIFKEPFENCWGTLKAIWKTALADAVVDMEIGAKERALITSLAWQWDVRMGEDKTETLTHNFDDKWLFTEAYFKRVSDQIGTARIEVRPNGVPPGVFRETTTQTFDGLIGPNSWTLPSRAWDLIDRFDGAFTDDVRAQFYGQATVLMTRPR